MDKLNWAQLGERLKTGGAQMGRLVSDKVKEILQAPTPESKIVDEATMETMEEPNWGLNLRICAMINSEELSGSEIVKAIKKKIMGKSALTQRLSLDLLEACTMNCEKMFSEVASEKVLDEMVRLIDDPHMDPENRARAMQLIRAWGESEDLAYLPVFHQTYMSLKERDRLPLVEGGNSPTMQYMDAYDHALPPSESYPIPHVGLDDVDRDAFLSSFQSLSVEEKKEFLEVTRNSLELLSSILNTETEPKPLKEELTVSMFEKCKQSQPALKRIIELTTNDEVMLFEALYLHDELQQVISKYEELEVSQNSVPEASDTTNCENSDAAQKHREDLTPNKDERDERFKDALGHDAKQMEKYDALKVNSTSQLGSQGETLVVDSQKGETSGSNNGVMDEIFEEGILLMEIIYFRKGYYKDNGGA